MSAYPERPSPRLNFLFNSSDDRLIWAILGILAWNVWDKQLWEAHMELKDVKNEEFRTKGFMVARGILSPRSKERYLLVIS